MKKLILFLMVFALTLSAFCFVSCSDDKDTSSDSEESKNEANSDNSESSSDSDASGTTSGDIPDLSIPDFSIPDFSTPVIDVNSTPEISGSDVTEPVPADVVGIYNGDVDLAPLLTAVFGKESECASFVVNVSLKLNEDFTTDMFVVSYLPEEKDSYYNAFAKLTYEVVVEQGYEGSYEDYLTETGGASALESEMPLNSIFDSFDGKYFVEDGNIAIVVGESEQEASVYLGTVVDDIITITGEHNWDGDLVDGTSIYPMVLKKIA